MNMVVKSMKEQLESLKFLSLRLYMRADESLMMPAYKGATLRGAFGGMFKDTVCMVPHRDCTRCVLHSQCPYPYVFETPVPETAERLRKYPSAPHPFVILPALERKRLYEAGDMFHFDLVLIGHGINYLPYFIHTFAQFSERRGLGKGRGKCTLMSVQGRGPKGQWVPVYDGADQVLYDHGPPTSIADLDRGKTAGASLTLLFQTPTRLVYSGRTVSDLYFHILCRMLLRRVSNLMYFHCDTELDVDFRGLIQKATRIETVSDELRWYDWKRYSSRQHRHVKQGGLVGPITFQGNLQPFWHLLQLGSLVHVGKGTSFGLGKYRIV